MYSVNKMERLDRQFETILNEETKLLLSKVVENVMSTRKAFGLTKAEVSRRCRIGQALLAKFEGNNMDNVELKTLVRLAAGLGLQVNISLSPFKATQ